MALTLLISELVKMLILQFGFQAQDLLAEAVHLSFKHLVVCLQADLELALPAMLYDGEDDVHHNETILPTTQGIIQVCSLKNTTFLINSDFILKFTI